MSKLLMMLPLAILIGCTDKNAGLPKESHFKANLPACDTEQLSRDITLNVRRGETAKAQQQIYEGIAKGRCRMFSPAETIILTNYNKGYYKFKPKGTDDSYKISFYASGEIIF